MSQKIKLNNSISIDLQTLLSTRLLVQANSGGGKSWLLRRILEQSHGKVQQIVIDLEGEFNTLREEYDYILAGKGGDTPTDPRSAALLARKILELGVSAIVDLYELQHHERKRFVKLFLNSMINAPKELWHPCLVIVDEAHQFCPEKGQSEAMEAVIDLATRGRKRGYCAVLATQRLSKLHKDAAAECNNKLIGRTGLDIDMKRASEELGFTSKQQRLSLRDLGAGEFYVFGPAISKEIIKTKIGGVHTTHPTAVAGSKIALKITPPTEKIRQVIKKLGDLPEEAQKEVHTIAEHKAIIRQLRHEKRMAEHSKAIPSQQLIENEVKKALAVREREIRGERSIMQKQVESFLRVIEQIGRICQRTLKEPLPKIPLPQPAYITRPVGSTPQPIFVAKPKPEKIYPSKILPPVEVELIEQERPLTGGALRMLKVLVSRFPMVLTRAQLATFARLSPRSGTYGTYLSILRSRGLIQENGNHFTATQEGIDYLGEIPNPPQTSEEVIEMWRRILKGGARRMFDVLIEIHPEPLFKEELGERTLLQSGSGTFGTYLSILRSNGLIEISDGNIKASENLFM